MEMLGSLIRQIGIMFVLMGIGYAMFRSKKITQKGSAEMGTVLLYLVIPSVIINSFCIERTAENIQKFFVSALISLAAMAVSMLVSWLLYGTRDGISCFSSAFSNAGFIGIPLVSAAVGPEAVFYVSTMIVLVNLLQWTFGVFVMTGDKAAMAPKKILTNPVTIALAAGMVIFFLGIPVPDFVKGILSALTGLNTPLAMIISGVYLAQADLLAMVKSRNNYAVSLVRLALIPVLTIVLMRVVPASDPAMKAAIMIAAAAPVGSNVAVFAQLYQKDYRKAVEHVCMSTLLCLVTLPLVLMLVQNFG